MQASPSSSSASPHSSLLGASPSSPSRPGSDQRQPRRAGRAQGPTGMFAQLMGQAQRMGQRMGEGLSKARPAPRQTPLRVSAQQRPDTSAAGESLQPSLQQQPQKPKRIDMLFKGDAQAVQPASPPTDPAETLLGSRLLFNLVLVRPWILVCGFWLLLLGSSAIALSGLADPGKPTVSATKTEVQPLQPLGVAPDTAVTSRLSESPVALNSDRRQNSTRQNGGRQAASGSNQPLPMWSLWVMVGACATGCILLSRPGLITFGAPERRRPSRVGRPHPPSRKRSTATPFRGPAARSRRAKGQTASSRRQPQPGRATLKPNYPQGQVMTVSHPGAIHQVTPTRAAQHKANPLVSFDVGGSSASVSSRGAVSQPGQPQGEQPQVSVIPAHESHALDWKDGSLAHKLDVRQNRSLKSFL